MTLGVLTFLSRDCEGAVRSLVQQFARPVLGAAMAVIALRSLSTLRPQLDRLHRQSR